ncbi:MAG: thioredoxin family protein, partial [Planctomycetes bacterium]|nr:thioredoxin family protein [Planctomycetota bacterium]
PAGPKKVSWLSSLNEGKKQAKKEKKPLLVNFYKASDLSSKAMDSQVFGKPDVVEALDGFVCVRIDMAKDKDTPAAFEITKPPDNRFLDFRGNAMEDVEPCGQIKDVKKFVALLKKISREAQEYVKMEEGKITWLKSVSEGVREAQEGNLPIFVYFSLGAG